MLLGISPELIFGGGGGGACLLQGNTGSTNPWLVLIWGGGCPQINTGVLEKALVTSTEPNQRSTNCQATVDNEKRHQNHPAGGTQEVSILYSGPFRDSRTIPKLVQRKQVETPRPPLQEKPGSAIGVLLGEIDGYPW